MRPHRPGRLRAGALTLALAGGSLAASDTPRKDPARQPPRPWTETERLPGENRATRLDGDRLARLQAAIRALAKNRRTLPGTDGIIDVRAALHVHSELSHDSRTPLARVVAAARRAGVRVVGFTEHPPKDRDYFLHGHRGRTDGVLFFPGAETHNFLAFPLRPTPHDDPGGAAGFAVAVRRSGGEVFLCHVEERMSFDHPALTGLEIYNTHADVKEETWLLAMLRDPTKWLTLKAAFDRYPQEAFGALLDYPTDYLRRYDELNRARRLTGVAGNDAHHNQSLAIRIADGGALDVRDGLDKSVLRLDPKKAAVLLPFTLGRKPGDVIFAIDIDPHERSLRHVSTHLLVPVPAELSAAERADPELGWLTEAMARTALQTARTYVAFDWLADPTGFSAEVLDQLPSGASKRVGVLGDEVVATAGRRLRVRAPLPGIIRVIRDGTLEWAELTDELNLPVDSPGVRRIEVLLDLAGERLPWILTSPIRFRTPGKPDRGA